MGCPPSAAARRTGAIINALSTDSPFGETVGVCSRRAERSKGRYPTGREYVAGPFWANAGLTQSRRYLQPGERS
jgi:hypothetical protein